MGDPVFTLFSFYVYRNLGRQAQGKAEQDWRAQGPSSMKQFPLQSWLCGKGDQNYHMRYRCKHI